MREFDQGAGTVDLMPQEMVRVLLNLLSNAFDAVAENAVESTESGNGSDRHEPTIRIGTRRDGEHVEILVEDDGPGITEDIRARIFVPFFTTKPAGSGTGLGLSLSHDIVTKGHGGSLKVESTVGKGTIFTISLPVNGASDGDSTLLKPAQEVQ